MPFIEHNGKRVLFIHIPRTGGTSIESWMKSLAPVRFRTVGLPPALHCTPQHFRMSDYDALFGKGYFNYAFAVTRNPYARIESEYRLRSALQEGGFFGEAMTFSMWLEIHLQRAKREPWLLDNHLRPQWEFVGDGLDVFRFESGIAAIVDRIAGILDIPFAQLGPPKLATDGRQPCSWDQADRQRVLDFYSSDFDRFGYAKDWPIDQ